jgi:predicted RNase H-like HicB family nuclease
VKRRYLIVVENGQHGENYSAYSPDVDGCVATGDTLCQTIDLMQEALKFHMEDMLLRGEDIPDGSDGIAISVNIALPQVSLS